MRAPFPFVARELTRILGAKLVAYIARVSETRAVREWAALGREPKDPAVALGTCAAFRAIVPPGDAETVSRNYRPRRVKPDKPPSGGTVEPLD